MNSIGKECNELKKIYEECFNTWFTEKFLKGDHHDDTCKPLFQIYNDCLKKAVKENNVDLKELEKTVLGTETERKPIRSDRNKSSPNS